MKRVVILLLVIFSLVSSAHALSVSNLEVYELGDDGFVVGWQTDEPATSQILYGTSGRLGGETANDVSLTTDHIVQINNLNPNTVYFFRATGTNAEGEQYFSVIGVTRTTETYGYPPGSFGIVNFHLVDSSTKERLRVLTDGETIDLSTYTGQVTVEAETFGAVESVLFFVDGRYWLTDNDERYYVWDDFSDWAGGSDMEFFARPFGMDSVEAETFSDTFGTGIEGVNKKVQVRFENKPADDPNDFPNDAPEDSPSDPPVDSPDDSPTTPPTSGAPTNPNAKLLFKSGFEGTTDVCLANENPSCSTNYQCDTTSVIKGVDNGFTWTTDLPGRPAGNIIQEVIGGGCCANGCLVSSKDQCQTVDVVRVDGPDGTPTNALYYNRIKDCSTGSYSRLQYIMRPDANGQDYDRFNPIYFRYWVRMQEDLDTTFRNGWRNLWEFYYPPGPNQWSNTFHLISNNGERRWLLDAKHYDSTNRDLLWREYSTKNIPEGGEWFLVEAYVKSGVDDGRIVIKIDGDVIFDAGGPGQPTSRGGTNNPNAVAMLKLSTSENNQEQWMDDFEVWSEDPMYDGVLSVPDTPVDPNSFGVSNFILNRGSGADDVVDILENGDVIDLADMNGLWIGAQTTGDTNSVLFFIDDQYYNTENEAPYTIYESFTQKITTPGVYKITAKGYSELSDYDSSVGNGVEGLSKTINIRVEDSRSTTPPTNPPTSPPINRPDQIPDLWPTIQTQNVGTKPTSTFVLTSASQLSSSANANKVAIVRNNINLGGATITPANNIWLQADGGVISNGRLSGTSYTIDPSSRRQLFATNLRFATLYQKPFYAEWYGARGNDGGNDATAIKAAIDASTNVHFQNQRYLMSSVTFTRSGDVQISGNNAIIEPVSTDINNYQWIIEPSFGTMVVHDLTFDGKERQCRGIRARSGFHADNLEIRNLYGPNWCVGIYMQHKGGAFDLTLRNSWIHSIDAEEDGQIASSKGFTRAFFWDRGGGVNGANVVIENSKMGNIYGDDGDVLSTHDVATYEHNSWLYSYNSHYYNGSRRVWKTFGSNVMAINNRFEFIPVNDPNKAVASAGIISFGPYGSLGDIRAKNLFLYDNYFDNTGEHPSGNIFFGNVRDVEMKGNTFNNVDVMPFRYTDDVRILDNDFINSRIAPYSLSYNPIASDWQVSGNEILYTSSTQGAAPFNDDAWAVLASYGTYNNWVLENNVVEREPGSRSGGSGPFVRISSSTYNNLVERNNRMGTVSFDYP